LEPSVIGAIIDLTKAPLGVLIVMMFALVLGTMITQAFEYEVIRVLEGYWGLHTASVPVMRMGLRWQQRRLMVLDTRRARITKKACRKSHASLLDDPDFDDQTVIILDRWSHNKPLEAYTEEDRARALSTDWIKKAPLSFIQRLDAIRRRTEFLPKPERILPTYLGNTLRAQEDRLELASNQSLRTYVIDRWEDMSDDLRLQYDQYHNRLNMYCVLVFVLLVLAVLSTAVFLVSEPRLGDFAIGFAASYAALAFVSYRAAILMARGLGDILASIKLATTKE
jgi:hypothetical protein